MTDVEIADVVSPRDRRDFIRLPWRLNAVRPAWVPPFLTDERRYLDPRHPARAYCDATFRLARRGETVIGRIAGFINRRHNEKIGARTARFGLLECVDDVAVARALLDSIGTWARTRGMDRLVGPMGFSDQDPEGFLIEGFDREPSLATHCNAEHLPRLLDECGYEKEVDYVCYRLEIPDELPGFYRRILGRVARRGTFSLVEFKKRSELKPYVEPVLALMGLTFEGLYGFVAPDPAERQELARQYLPLLEPRYVKVVEKAGELVGFIVCIPNIAPGLRAANGRLFPLGFIHVLRAMRMSRQLDVLIGGIREDCRGQGVDVLLGAAVLTEARKAGFESIDSHLHVESNRAVRAEMERLGGVIYKRFRIYGRSLEG